MNLCKRTRGNPEGGNSILLLVVVLGLFLLGVVGVAVDYSNLWFHRQMAQAAADAACQATALDYEVVDAGGTWPAGTNYTQGASFVCGGKTTTATPCAYAGLNGYTSTSTLAANTPGNQVSVSYPPSVPGYTFPRGYTPPANPFIRIDILDRAKVYFSGIVTGNNTSDVRAFATCGVVAQNSAVPILVLAPSGSDTLNLQGNPSISILGGPTRSIQVNSSDSSSVNIGGSSSVDLTSAGPHDTGADFGNSGGPVTNPGITFGSTGQYVDPAPPMPDPFANLPNPPKPAAAQASQAVSNGASNTATTDVNCPSGSSCTRFYPGYYASVLDVGGTVGLFVNGVYYLNGGLKLDTLGDARPASQLPTTTDPNAPDGTFFFFTNGSGIDIKSNFAKHTFTAYAGAISCPGGPAPNPAPNLTGSLFLAPCTGPYADPGGYRGILFMHEHTSSGTLNMGGGGQLTYIGEIYWHDISWGSSIATSGNSGGTAYVLGDIVVDTISMGGTSGIIMELNPSAGWTALKVALLQ